MRLIRTLVGMTMLLAALGTPLFAEQPPRQPPQQEEFVPIDELPPEEQVPAAPMVVAAYSFVWVAFLVYVFMLVKRIRRVEADLAALERGGH
jgi:CcmD family protein